MGSAFLSALGATPPDASSSHDAIQRLATEVRNRGWICFSARSEKGDWDLFVSRPDGSRQRNLTGTPEWSEFSPQFSRHGRKLLYRRMPRDEVLDNNRHGGQGELILADADGGSPVALAGPGELPWASFSPDGAMIASLSIKGISFFHLGVRQVVRTLPRKGFFQQMTWSPDGKWLVGVANSFGVGWSIARMDVATGEAGAVNRVDCCTPDWFPGSRDVIFSWRPPGQQANEGYGWTQLWRATLHGLTRQLVYAEEGRHVYGGQVSPDGRYVLFTGNLHEDGDPANAGAPMALMRLSDGPIIGGASPELRALHPEAKDGPVLTLPAGWEPCWTFHELPGAPDSPPVSSLPGTAVGAVPSTAGPSSELASMAAELLPLGSLVFSAKSDRGDWDLYLMRPDGSGRRPLTDTPEFNEAGARFSPDGRRLLYYRLPQSEPVDNNNYGTFELVIAQADGSAPVVYGKDFPWASWGPDGRQVACLGPKTIRIVDATTRAVMREFPRQGIVEQLVWSPDGRYLAGTANGLGQFWNIGCLEVGTGRIHAVSEIERYNCTPDWTPDSKQLVYARGIIPEQPGHAELWVASADGTKRRRLYAESDQHLYGGCVSPDGRFVLFTRSRADLGRVPEIEMAIIRWPQAESATPGSIPRLDLGSGWEPHWTANDILK
ncbi:MAG: TolB family protein [Limisphaerales bacterium]